MRWILPQSPEKPPKFSNHFYFMYPNGNTQLQYRKWWFPLRLALYIFPFCSELCKYVSIISTRFPTDKTLKEICHVFKTIMLHPSTAPPLNVKLKRVFKVQHMLYNKSTGGNTISKCLHTEEFTRNVRVLLYQVYSTIYNQINCN